MTKPANMRDEIVECDRVWALDDSVVEARLAALGLDPAELLHGLDAMLGSEMANAPEPERPVRCPAAPPRVPSAAFEDTPCASAFEVSGRVKFFDAPKRFGFIVPDDGRADVLLHISCLHAAGHATARMGARIQALAFRGPRGLQALRVLSIDESTAVHPSQLVQRTHAKVEAESDWEEMTVRWYNLKRGYGFVNRGEGAPDVFVHADTLRRWGVQPLRPGQVVEVRWGTTGKGRMAAEIRHPRDATSLPAVH